MSYEASIAAALQQVLTGPLGVDADQVTELANWVEVPKDTKMGDFAFPCFRLARVLRKKPNLIADDIMTHLPGVVAAADGLASVSAAGPYLNFRVDRAAMAAGLIPAILDGSFQAPRAAVGEKVMIEYSQPNTHKAFHVGHTRNVALGDALIHLYEWNGYEVIAANYIGDEGAHIAKCLWYYQNHFDGQVPDTNLGEFLGILYTNASNMLDFKKLSQVPMAKVTIAKVLEIHEIPGQKAKRVLVDTGSAQVQVVCGGTGYTVGDLVAYGGLGSRVNGRLVGEIEKFGVASKGMLLSEAEMGLNDDKMQLGLFPADAVLGTEVAEFYRTDEAPEGRPVLEVMAEREAGVADTLKRIEAREEETYALFEKTKKWSMDEFHAIYDWLGARFDHYFFESGVGHEGKKMVLDYLDKGVLVKSEGAVGADLSDRKLPFFLLLKSNGSGLYSTKDIALAHEKFDVFGVDRSIYVVDISQSLHFQQVFATLEKMGYAKAKNCYHLAYGMVTGPRGEKLASRSGNVILLSELREALIETVTAKHLEKYRGEWSDADIAAAAHVVAKSVIRYGMTNQDNGRNIEFKLEDWVSETGNTGPYMLYAYARTQSILRKVEYNAEAVDWSLLSHDAETALLTKLADFPKVAARACKENSPHVMCIYLFELSKVFSSFFTNCSVKNAESDALRAGRALMTAATGKILKKGLGLLGIDTLDRM